MEVLVCQSFMFSDSSVKEEMNSIRVALHGGYGYAGYFNRTALSSVPVKISGGSLGYMMDISYDYCITKKIALGASVSCLAGSVSKFRCKTFSGESQTAELGGDTRESLMHMDVSVGVRFYL